MRSPGPVGFGLAVTALVAGCSLFADFDDLSQRTIIVQPEAGAGGGAPPSVLPGAVLDAGSDASPRPPSTIDCARAGDFCESFDTQAFRQRFSRVEETQGVIAFETATVSSPLGAASFALPSAGDDSGAVRLVHVVGEVAAKITVEMRVLVVGRDTSRELSFLSLSAENLGDPSSRLDLVTTIGADTLRMFESGQTIPPSGHDLSSSWPVGVWRLVRVVMNTREKRTECWIDNEQLLDFALEGQWAVRDQMLFALGLWGETGKVDTRIIVDDFKVRLE